MEVEFIKNLPQFTRLKKIKQLGLCYRIFPRATHTRYTHSIGTCTVAQQIINNLPRITRKQKQLITIAALVHDVGHCAYSHFFDQYLRPTKHHEERSCEFVRFLQQQYGTQLHLSVRDADAICACILGIEHISLPKHLREIIKSPYIDADRLDYLRRDALSLGINHNINFETCIQNVFIGSKGHLRFPQQEQLLQLREQLFQKYWDTRVTQLNEQLRDKLKSHINQIHKLDWYELVDTHILFHV